MMCREALLLQVAGLSNPRCHLCLATAQEIFDACSPDCPDLHSPTGDDDNRLGGLVCDGSESEPK